MVDSNEVISGDNSTKEVLSSQEALVKLFLFLKLSIQFEEIPMEGNNSCNTKLDSLLSCYIKDRILIQFLYRSAFLLCECQLTYIHQKARDNKESSIKMGTK